MSDIKGIERVSASPAMPGACAAAAPSLQTCNTGPYKQDVKKQIDKALAQAKASPQPPMEDLWANIWQGEPPGGEGGQSGGPA